MPGVSIQFDPNAFTAGGPMEKYANDKAKARWTISGHVESQPEVGGNAREDYGLPLNPYHALVILYGSPTWFETVQEFNLLPYAEYRAAIANAVERGILQVLGTAGTPVTVAAIRGGTVS